jgi:hypothetical protein
MLSGGAIMLDALGIDGCCAECVAFPHERHVATKHQSEDCF